MSVGRFSRFVLCCKGLVCFDDGSCVKLQLGFRVGWLTGIVPVSWFRLCGSCVINSSRTCTAVALVSKTAAIHAPFLSVFCLVNFLFLPLFCVGQGSCLSNNSGTGSLPHGLVWLVLIVLCSIWVGCVPVMAMALVSTSRRQLG